MNILNLPLLRRTFLCLTDIQLFNHVLVKSRSHFISLFKCSRYVSKSKKFWCYKKLWQYKQDKCGKLKSHDFFISQPKVSIRLINIETSHLWKKSALFLNGYSLLHELNVVWLRMSLISGLPLAQLRESEAEKVVHIQRCIFFNLERNYKPFISIK